MSEVELSNIQKLDIRSLSDFETADILYKVCFFFRQNNVFDKKRRWKDSRKETFDQLAIFWWNAPVKRETPPAPQDPKDAAISKRY